MTLDSQYTLFREKVYNHGNHISLQMNFLISLVTCKNSLNYQDGQATFQDMTYALEEYDSLCTELFTLVFNTEQTGKTHRQSSVCSQGVGVQCSGQSSRFSGLYPNSTNSQEDHGIRTPEFYFYVQHFSIIKWNATLKYEMQCFS